MGVKEQRVSFIRGGRAASDLIDALEYTIEDLTYRMDNGSDFDDEESKPGVRRGIARYRRLIDRLAADEV